MGLSSSEIHHYNIACCKLCFTIYVLHVPSTVLLTADLTAKVIINPTLASSKIEPNTHYVESRTDNYILCDLLCSFYCHSSQYPLMCVCSRYLDLVVQRI